MNKVLNAFTDENKAKLAGLPDTSGTVERITAIRSLTLVVSSESTISFDPAQTVGANGLVVNVSGNVECLAGGDGHYQGSFKVYVDESSDPTIYSWIEIKPQSTGVWEVSPASLFKTKLKEDSGLCIPLNGGIDLLEGDEIRFKTRATSGTSTLVTQTDTGPALGTVTQFAAVLNMWRIGPVNI